MNQLFSILFFFITLYLPFFSADVRKLPKEESSVVFVHLGKRLPPYLQSAVSQARLFHEGPIVVVAHRKALRKAPIEGATMIAYETLKQSDAHRHFNRHSTLDKVFRNGFWHYAVERFFVLDDLMRKYGLKNVIHLESDVMLYQETAKLVPLLANHYKGLAVPFDNETRAIPSFVYVPNPRAIEKLTQFLSHLEGVYDMEALGAYRDVKCAHCIDALPIVDKRYLEDENIEGKHLDAYANYVDQFDSIFDAAAIGQYLGGTDPRNNDPKGTFVNPHAVILSSKMEYEWQKDEHERLIPYATYKGVKRRINNLHIHSKALEHFRSDFH